MQELIASYPELSEEEAKLIFIRQSAQEAYEKGEIKESTDTFFIEVIQIATAASMSRDDIGQHIGNLEKIRDYLAAFTQGLGKGLEKDVEPKIKARQAKEAAEKRKGKSKKEQKENKVNDLIAMAVQAAKSGDPLSTPKKTTKLAKTKCEKCNKEVFSLKFHKC